jgi:inositol polyphosphate 5-phosphatase INPP5B/F
VLSSDHKPLDAVFLLRYEAVVPELKAKVHAEVAKELDKAENEGRPDVTVVVDKHRDGDVEKDDSDLGRFEGVWFGDVRWGQRQIRTLTIANTGRVEAQFSFLKRPVDGNQSTGIAPKWVNLKVNDTCVASSSGGTELITLEPGESCVVELEVRIFDLQTAHDLNEGLIELDDVLVLRVENGRDHFIPLRGNWLETTLSRSIDKLVRIPEGGIRRLQRQKPDGSKGRSSSSGSSSKKGSAKPAMADLKIPKVAEPEAMCPAEETAVASPTSQTGAAADSLQQQPVRFSAPRELFKLTEAVEGLAGRVVAEWEMMHPPQPPQQSGIEESATAPWVEHAAWPFDEACWSEKGTSGFEEALGYLCDALDQDRDVVSGFPDTMPKMQRLYVLAHFLLLFLKGMPDGVITAEMWAAVDAYLAEKEKENAKRKTTQQQDDGEEERTAIQEILSEIPGHNISFILVLNMLERIITEVSNAATAEGSSATPRTSQESPLPQSPMSPGKKTTGTLRRMTMLGRGAGMSGGPSAATAAMHTLRKDDRGRAVAKIFAEAVARMNITEKQKAAQEKRRVRVLEMFLCKGDG